MCGIAGYFGFDRTAEQRIDLMTQAQAHRGPDAMGKKIAHVGGSVLALGHRRLSIIDLSEAGAQPMEHPETGNIIVFNGEIYNYPELREELQSAGSIFRSASDTEVVLHAFAHWGTDCFSKLCGMFALAIYEPARRRLLVARDPLGMKPLYYIITPDGFAFASELRALMTSGLIPFEIDQEGLIGFLSYGAVQEPHTLIAGARLMPSGTWGALDLSRPVPTDIDFKNHWEFPSPRKHADRDEAVVEIGYLLRKVVKRHLLSDVPVAVFLSGGIDSSSIANLASQSDPSVQAFTISLRDKNLDEAEMAGESARRFGIDHTTLSLNADEALRQALKYFSAIDQPTIDGLNTFIISGAVCGAGIKVALSGLGADELFGGYSTFKYIRQWMWWARLFSRIPTPVRIGLARAALAVLPPTRRVKGMDIAEAEPSIASFGLLRRRLFSNSELRELKIELGVSETTEFANVSGYARQSLDWLVDDPEAALCVLESMGYMRNMLLRDADVFGMAHGLEIRAPFLDRELIDFLYTLPGDMKRPDQGINKPLLVAALDGLLPPSLLKLSKRGFSVMQYEWLRGPLKDFCESALANAADILGADTAWKPWRKFLEQGDDRYWSRVWACAALGAWQKNILQYMEVHRLESTN